jgi:hypothetical protein
VAVGIVKVAGTGTANATSASFSMQCKGTDRVLLVGISLRSNVGVTAVTYNGVAMTLGGSGTGSFQSTYVYYMVAPPVGTFTVAITLGGASNGAFGAVCLNGVHQTTPFGTWATNNGNSTSPSVAVATVAGDFTFAHIGWKDTGNAITYGQTQITDGTTPWYWGGTGVDPANNPNSGGEWTAAAGTTTTMTGTITSNRWLCVGVAVKAAPKRILSEHDYL